MGLQQRVGLTTTQAPYIEKAKHDGKLFIEQPYELYSEENQETWRELFRRIRPRWEKYANHRFLEGLQRLAMNPNHIPKLSEINQFLAPLTGFTARAVPGHIPVYHFFESLRQRQFPTTITIRDYSKLDYLSEPDIFHDAVGHVPMHTDRRFADVLVKFGDIAYELTQRLREMKDHEVRTRYLQNVIRAMARFYWFTIEFGLIRQGNEVKVLGSGLLSSYGEVAHCLESPEVQRFPLQLEWVINQYYEIDHYQNTLFIVDSFEHLFSQVEKLEKWMKEGKLYSVAPGVSDMSEEDLRLFFEAQIKS